MTDPLHAAQAALGYRFRRPEHLTLALTHRSAARRNNERLEFLGDAVLNAVVSMALFEQLDELEEGSLTRLRASLVNQTALAGIARTLRLGDYLLLGPGEMKSGGERRDSILADSLEAVIGAVYLDGGFEAAREVVLRLFAAPLRTLPPPEALKDAKTRLQERLQARGLPLPEYAVERVSGEAHRQRFRVSCTVPALALRTEAEAGSRRSAEQLAAERALEQWHD